MVSNQFKKIMGDKSGIDLKVLILGVMAVAYFVFAGVILSLENLFLLLFDVFFATLGFILYFFSNKTTPIAIIGLILCLLRLVPFLILSLGAFLG